MSVAVSIIPATAEHAHLIAPRVSERNLCRVWERQGRTPEQAVLYSMRKSAYSYAGIANGEVATIFGLAVESLISDRAMPWLVPTPLIATYWRPFVRLSRLWISEMRASYPEMAGIVDDTNDVSKRWLAWLGFALSEPAHNEILGASVRHFAMGR